MKTLVDMNVVFPKLCIKHTNITSMHMLREKKSLICPLCSNILTAQHFSFDKQLKEPWILTTSQELRWVMIIAVRKQLSKFAVFSQFSMRAFNDATS